MNDLTKHLNTEGMSQLFSPIWAENVCLMIAFGTLKNTHVLNQTQYLKKQFTYLNYIYKAINIDTNKLNVTITLLQCN